MRIIITGGTGLIGTALAESLVADGHEVIILSRSPDQKANVIPAGAQIVGWDAKTAEGWGHLADGADAIVNLAGNPIDGPGFLPSRWTDERKQLMHQSRIHAGHAVVQAIEQAQNKPKVLIQSSAVGYYGPRGDEIVLESTEPARDFLGKLCVEWEAVTQPVEDLGVRYVTLRTGLPISMKGGAFPLLVLPIKYFMLYRTLGSGNQWYPWIHMDDEVRAIRFLIETPDAHGPFNLSAPNPEMQKDIAGAIGRVLRRPSFLPIPAFVLRLLFGEVSVVVLTGQRAVPEKLRAAGFTWEYPELEPALQDLLGK